MIDSPEQTVSLRRHLAPIRRFKWLIFTFCMAAAITSLALTYMTSERYLAGVMVLYQPRESVSFQPKTREALGFPLPLVALESIASTLEDMIKSDSILEQTVRTLHLDVKRKRPPAGWLMTTFQNSKDWFKERRQDAWEILRFGRVLPRDPFRGAMATLRNNVSLKRTNKAYTFRLELLDDDPVRAAQTVDVMGQLLAQSLVSGEIRTATEARQNIEKRLLQQAGEVAQLRAASEALKQRTGVSSLSEELSLRVHSINDFEGDLAKVRHDLSAAEKRRTELISQLQHQDAVVNYSATTEDNPLYSQLRLAQSQLEVERSGLLQKYTTENQDVKAVDAKLAETRRRLGAEQPKLLHSESTRLSDVHEKLLSDKLSVDAEVESLKAKEISLTRTLGDENDLAKKLTQSEPGSDQIALRLSAAEKSFGLINDAYQEARLAESKTVSEVAFDGNALVPTEPARPIKILHVGVTLFLSLVIGVAGAFFVSYFDDTIRDVEDAQRVLESQVFATIPEFGRSTGASLGAPPAA